MTEEQYQRMIDAALELYDEQVQSYVRKLEQRVMSLEREDIQKSRQIATLINEVADLKDDVRHKDEQREDYTSRTSSRAGERTRRYERHVQALEQQVRDLGGTPVLEPA